MGEHEEHHGHGNGFIQKLKKVPKWVWIAAAGILVFVFYARSKSGGSAAVPGFISGSGPGVGTSPGDSSGGGLGGGGLGGTPGPTPGGGTGGIVNPPNYLDPIIAALDNLSKTQMEASSALSNQLNGLAGSISAQPSMITPHLSTDAGITQNANILSKYSSFIPYVDPENMFGQSSAHIAQIAAFTQGFGGANYNTATGDTKKSLIEAEKNIKNPTAEYKQAEISRTNSVIAYRTATGQDTAAQYAHLDRVVNAVVNTPTAARQEAPRPVVVPAPVQSNQKTYLQNLAATGSAGNKVWAQQQLKAGKY